MMFMCRTPPVDGDKYHIVGAVREADPEVEPVHSFWTNASVKALMAEQGPQPKYISVCGQVHGDWRSIQTSETPFAGELCRRCAA